jgi:hypothetical protein
MARWSPGNSCSTARQRQKNGGFELPKSSEPALRQIRDVPVVLATVVAERETLRKRSCRPRKRWDAATAAHRYPAARSVSGTHAPGLRKASFKPMRTGTVTGDASASRHRPAHRRRPPVRAGGLATQRARSARHDRCFPCDRDDCGARVGGLAAPCHCRISPRHKQPSSPTTPAAFPAP